jgi:signal peptide peptidase SppA
MGIDPRAEALTAELRCSLWAIRPEAMRAIAAAIAAGEEGKLELGAARPDKARRAGAGAVAVVPLTGVITPRGSLLQMLFGGNSGGLMGFRESFRDAVGDDSIGTIVLDVDSPGGSTDLVTETAAEIRNARGRKPIVAVANTDAGSAAAWIAAQADEVVVTPSGMIGSIGVFALHIDESEALSMEGLKPTFISAGRFKTEGNSLEPLSDEARDHIQGMVDDVHDLFVADVAAGRGVPETMVREKFGEGRMLRAEAAVAAGLADRVDTLEGTLARALDPQTRPEPRKASERAPSVNAVEDEVPEDRESGKVPSQDARKIEAEALRAVASSAFVNR